MQNCKCSVSRRTLAEKWHLFISFISGLKWTCHDDINKSFEWKEWLEDIKHHSIIQINTSSNTKYAIYILKIKNIEITSDLSSQCVCFYIPKLVSSYLSVIPGFYAVLLSLNIYG